MILELDCGNSLIKWRLISAPNSQMMQQGSAENASELIEGLRRLHALALSGCRMVSVRSGPETGEIMAAVTECLGVEVVVARPARQLGGVTNGYEDYAALGLDRWLAVVAAYDLSRGPCLVVDLGTAATVDLVNADGLHLGGYITPGLSLLREQLFGHTKRIRYSAALAEQSTVSVYPGTTTAEAVERGCRLMVKSYITSQIGDASQWLGTDFSIYVTGGDSSLLADLPGVKIVPDLVFKGLEIACS